MKHYLHKLRSYVANPEKNVHMFRMVYLRSLDDQLILQIEDGQNLLVGRLPKCDIVLDDGSVSSQHARLHLEEDLLRIVDMGSTNGTRVNYASISDPTYLLDGDTLEIGNVSFTVDGTSLRSPSAKTTGMQAIVDLDPLEASQEMSDTMLTIPIPDEEELEQMIQEAAAKPPQEGETEEGEPKEKVFLSPEVISFQIALGILLVGGLMLLTLIWLCPDSL